MLKDRLKVLIGVLGLGLCFFSHSYASTSEASAFRAQEALSEVLSHELHYIGKGLLYGSISIDSCLFANDKVLVLHRYCTQPEVGAGDVTVYSVERKQSLNIHAESPNNATPISQTDPSTYPSEYWYMDLLSLDPEISLDMSFDSFAKIYQKTLSSPVPMCLVSSEFTQCDPAMESYASVWLPSTLEFRKSPGAAWQQTLRLLKNLAQ